MPVALLIGLGGATTKPVALRVACIAFAFPPQGVPRSLPPFRVLSYRLGIWLLSLALSSCRVRSGKEFAMRSPLVSGLLAFSQRGPLESTRPVGDVSRVAKLKMPVNFFLQIDCI